MKRFTRTLIIAALMTALPYSLSAQDEELANKITLKRVKAEQILETVPSVSEVVDERFDQATRKFDGVATRTREVVPPDRERVVAHLRQKDGSTKKYYSIRIGEVLYMRREDGDWEQSDSREFSGPIAGVQVSATYQYLGEEKLSGTTVDVFKIRSRYSYRKEPSTSGNETTYYFDRSGQLRKTVIEAFDKLGPTSRITTHYSYPKAIRIEAPINNK